MIPQPKHEPFHFYNSKYRNLTFDQVYDLLLEFIKQAPHNEYKLSIGTDSQVKNSTIFVTAIHLHRIGRGAIGFLTRHIVSRPIKSIREKIFYETSKTLEVASWFTDDKINVLVDCILNSPGLLGDIHFEFHLDIGKSGATRELIGEMISMAKGTPFEPKIKPDSYAASSYANRYTKGFEYWSHDILKK